LSGSIQGQGSVPFASVTVPDDRDEIAMTTRFDQQYAEAVLSIMIGDALDETRQHFLESWLRLRFHVERRIIESAEVRKEIITQPRNARPARSKAKGAVQPSLGCGRFRSDVWPQGPEIEHKEAARAFVEKRPLRLFAND
jgi:hypothetical protein